MLNENIRMAPAAPMTQEEIDAVNAATSIAEYHQCKYAIKGRRGCFFPSDWVAQTQSTRIRLGL